MKKYIRLPHTTDQSLRAWSAVDEYILRYFAEDTIDLDNILIVHDRFGYLTCSLIKHDPISITYLASQREAILHNAQNLSIPETRLKILTALDQYGENTKLAILKIPKSQDLLRLYLFKLSISLSSDGKVIAGFMTRHFTKAILEIASDFFDHVEQTRAWKKSRLLILYSPKKVPSNSINLINTVEYKSDQYQQYLGVFSANHIDYATQFLLEKLELRDDEKSFLDIGCGNGVIGKYLLSKKDWEKAVLMDDSILATSSAALNLSAYDTAEIISQYSLDQFSDNQFDLVITNPPFHFEYEVDPSIAIHLMEDTHRILSAHGRLIIVANRHLNYKSQLSKWYNEVSILAENDKFVIYEARK